MRTWLVTGGCGFIGSHLVDFLLARGDAVRVLDDLSTGRRENLDPRAELLVGDVADAQLVARAMEGVDGCFHLAAVASVQRGNEDWLGTHRTNLTGTIAVLDTARARGDGRARPVVYASSAAVLGDNPAVPLSETAETRPLSAYGADKLGCEQHARVAWTVHGVPSVGFRFFNVYGPGQDPKSPYSGVIAIFADRAATGQPLRIDGDGGQTRDFVYVGDVVRHLAAGMDSCSSGAAVYNVCTGRPTTILELAQVIRRLAGSGAPLVHAEARAGDIRISYGDPARATAAFGIRAETRIEEGLRLTLASLPQPAGA
ncbi:NAD-dependent epimerase/dehydratase family protein [Arenibaculum pallidiluteum]|uniref:NAD-dependent epimerase/dehydratase family protein n=1 Tax=Arenibaculum pallidiluteum TaxID=2812559 RepID=UPI001A977D23|nr:NAD-dependent epimerase/dehydratase family protein [Arenibaculum pallidiluteum]